MKQQNHAPNPAKPQTKPKVFSTIGGNSLMAQKYEPLQFSIEKSYHTVFSSLREAQVLKVNIPK